MRCDRTFEPDEFLTCDCQHPCAHDADMVFFSEGLLAGTPVATPDGWVAVDHLDPGDQVLTFDNGPMRIAERHEALPAEPDVWPVVHWPRAIPPGVLGNRATLRLLPGQLVLLESDTAEAMFGDPFALIPARALDGWRGIAPERPMPDERTICLLFDTEQIVYASSATLLHCPGALGEDLAVLHHLSRAAQAAYAPLSLTAARQLVACLMAEDIGAALSQAAPRGGQAAFAGAEKRP